MNVPDEHKDLLKFVEDKFYSYIENMINSQEELALMGVRPDKTINLMKEENLAKELYVNTYNLYFEESELTELSSKVRELDLIQKQLDSILAGKVDLMEDKAYQILESWLTHNMEHITK